jgi:hypothetical protein
MQFAVLFSRPSLIINGSYDGSVYANTNVLSFPVNPMFVSTGSDPFITWMAFVGTAFRYWRGSLAFNIDFRCSSMTSSRVRIAWVPADASPVTTINNDGDYVNRIVDITGDTSVKFIVPDMHGNIYRRNWTGAGVESYLTTPTLQEWFNGYIYITVLGPPTVTQSAGTSTVYVNVWQTAGPDFEYAGPVNANVCYTLFQVSPPSFEERVSAEKKQRALAIREAHTAGLIDIKINRIDGMVMGDGYIGSLRTLLHRFGTVSFPTTSASQANYTIQCNPDASSVSGDSNTTIGDPGFHTNLYWFASAFTGWRGRINVNIVPYTGAIVCTRVSHRHPTDTLVTSIGDNGIAMNTSASSIINVAVPYYSTARYTPFNAKLGNTGFDTNMGNVYPLGSTLDVRSDYASSGGSSAVLVSAADDFSFVWEMPPGGFVTPSTYSGPRITRLPVNGGLSLYRVLS